LDAKKTPQRVTIGREFTSSNDTSNPAK